MAWLEKLLPPRIKRNARNRKSVPEGLWSKCLSCEGVLYVSELVSNMQVCPKCGFHHRLRARARLDMLLDATGREEIAAHIAPADPLRFKDSRRYVDRIAAAEEETGEADALVVMRGSIHERDVVLACFEFDFMGGSMGSVVGERFVQGVRMACAAGIPFICITASGGARMQEGLLSLMQMAKTTAALTRLSELRLPFITVLTDPTMGGVSASFAFVGDIVLAEPGALIGFAGPRVIEQTVRETLPDGFQRAEFLLEKGAIDMIVDRRELRNILAQLLAKLQLAPVPEALAANAKNGV